MYAVLGITRALTFFGILCAVIALGFAAYAPPANHADVIAWWKIASASVANAAFLLMILGQTRAFPLICRLPLIRDWFPNIDGEWEAELESNWPVLQRLLDPSAASATGAPVKAKVVIRSRLLFIRINLASSDRYSTSKTVFVRASRDEEDGGIQLHYVYRNTTLKPLSTDSGAHNGAACLSIEGDPVNPWMEGVYWTDRNWHRGLNTAGKITLRRV